MNLLIIKSLLNYRYYLCVRDGNGNLQKGHYACPGTTYFSKFYKRCIDSTMSSCVPSESQTTSTTLAPTTTQSSSTCKMAGSFINLDVPHCMAYYNCVQIPGKLVRIDHQCPNGTVYHLIQKHCVPDSEYTCPL